jgi:steroid 5-alpha reductase family enzyme
VTSACTPQFWELYNALPQEVRALTLKNYQLWRENPQHPSLRFKHLEDGVWSVRIGIHYRALGERRGEDMRWFWIGHHAAYDRLTR